tara:strand:+ start:1183 stop:1290 length:108 start_codon:yes stop_codon:yes gene_type:complete
MIYSVTIQFFVQLNFQKNGGNKDSDTISVTFLGNI